MDMKKTIILGLLMFGPLASQAQVRVITGPSTETTAPTEQIYVAEGGSYTLRPLSGGSILLSPGALITTDGSALTLPTTSTADMNYVKTVTPRVASTNPAGLKLSQKNVSYQYFDGLGRPVQQVAQAASPQFKDIVSNVGYDGVGRQYREYLPYSPLTNDGAYKNDWENSQPAFYATGTTTDRIANDSKPYSETLYEPSPLNRPDKNYAPGLAWHAENTSVRHGYHVNAHGTGSGQEKVIAWDINNGSLVRHQEVIGYVLPNGYYYTGQLQIKSTKDENGNEVREYTDKLGRIVLKKVQDEDSPVLSTDSDWAQTYYVYDDFGNLRFVLQPELVSTLATGTSAPNADQLDQFVFQYRYDGRQRMIRKKVPGSGWIDMLYDQWDRLVLVQDANQAAVATTSKEYTYTKYDALNRPILTGIWSTSTAIGTLRTQAMAHTTRHESRNTGNIGYTLNQSYPTGATDANKVLSATYYDDYAQQATWGAGFAFVPEMGHTAASQNTRVKGQVTGSLTQVLNSSPVQWLKSVTYYDSKYRPIQTITENHLGGTDRVTTTYDFIGQVTATQRTHTASGQPTLVLKERFDYDHAGRLLRHYHQVGAQAEVLLAEHSYNELGQLVEKDLHSENNGTSHLQSVDYRYNIRGWLGSINNHNFSNDAGVTNNDTNDLFGMMLRYNVDHVTGAGTAQYNGNIGEITWREKQSNKLQGYGFSYDAMNRLKNATYRQYNSSNSSWAGSAENDRFNESISLYDKNGNIKALSRNSEIGAMDILDYTYEGNRLIRVHDMGNAAQGFVNGSTSTTATEYTYDANGNMKIDTNKGISSIIYNYLNLPQSVVKSTTTIDYTYDATGQKLKKVSNYGGNLSTTDYIGGIHYENNLLTFVQTAEGRVRKEGTSWIYEYNLTDHLGNVRVSFDKNPTSGVARLIQKDDYYPFGGTFNSYASGTENLYKYNGKEEQKETGWMDYGARMYDPWLGRWNHIDPLAMEYHDVSPYIYSMNNPIRFIDPDGNQVWDMTTDKAHKSALARFARTEQGKAFLAQYAKAGDVIGGVKFTQDGKYSHQNVAFYSANLGGRTRGITRSYLRTKQSPRGLALGHVTKSTVRENLGGLDNLSFAVDIRNGLTEDEALETIGHESFIHVDKTTKDVEKGVADLKDGKFGSGEGLFEGFADFMSGLSGDESDHKLAVDGKAATMEEFVDALDQVTGGTKFRDMYDSWKEAEKKRLGDNH